MNENGNTKPKDFILNCMENRIHALGSDLITNEKYQFLLNQHSEFFNKIYASLSEDIKPLLSEYNDKENEISGFSETFYYKNGFMDAVKFFKTFFLDNNGTI